MRGIRRSTVILREKSRFMVLLSGDAVLGVSGKSMSRKEPSFHISICASSDLDGYGVCGSTKYVQTPWQVGNASEEGVVVYACLYSPCIWHYYVSCSGAHQSNRITMPPSAHATSKHYSLIKEYSLRRVIEYMGHQLDGRR